MLNICQIKIQHLCIHVFMTEKIKQEKKYPLKNSDDAMIIYLFSIKTKSTCIDYLRQHGIDKKNICKFNKNDRMNVTMNLNNYVYNDIL